MQNVHQKKRKHVHQAGNDDCPERRRFREHHHRNLERIPFFPCAVEQHETADAKAEQPRRRPLQDHRQSRRDSHGNRKPLRKVRTNVCIPKQRGCQRQQVNDEPRCPVTQEEVLRILRCCIHPCREQNHGQAVDEHICARNFCDTFDEGIVSCAQPNIAHQCDAQVIHQRAEIRNAAATSKRGDWLPENRRNHQHCYAK